MNRIESISVVQTTPRQSMPSRFDVALQNAANHLARAASGGLELAAPAIPGGTFLLGAVRAATQPAPGTAPVTAAAPFVGGGALGTAGGSGSAIGAGTGIVGGAAAGAATGASGETDIMASARALQAESQAYNAQYLQLQESMQRENREFTALSNVMKIKHDTARAAIGNIQ